MERDLVNLQNALMSYPKPVKFTEVFTFNPIALSLQELLDLDEAGDICPNSLSECLVCRRRFEESSAMLRGSRYTRGYVCAYCWNSDYLFCFYCKRDLHNIKFHVDHVTPRIVAERHKSYLEIIDNPSNLVIACPQCNHSKNSKTGIEFLQYLKYSLSPIEMKALVKIKPHSTWKTAEQIHLPSGRTVNINWQLQWWVSGEFHYRWTYDPIVWGNAS